jgi:hypothetical protein
MKIDRKWDFSILEGGRMRACSQNAINREEFYNENIASQPPPMEGGPRKNVQHRETSGVRVHSRRSSASAKGSLEVERSQQSGLPAK